MKVLAIILFNCMEEFVTIRLVYFFLRIYTHSHTYIRGKMFICMFIYVYVRMYTVVCIDMLGEILYIQCTHMSVYGYMIIVLIHYSLLYYKNTQNLFIRVNCYLMRC